MPSLCGSEKRKRDRMRGGGPVGSVQKMCMEHSKLWLSYQKLKRGSVKSFSHRKVQIVHSLLLLFRTDCTLWSTVTCDWRISCWWTLINLTLLSITSMVCGVQGWDQVVRGDFWGCTGGFRGCGAGSRGCRGRSWCPWWRRASLPRVSPWFAGPGQSSDWKNK